MAPICIVICKQYLVISQYYDIADIDSKNSVIKELISPFKNLTRFWRRSTKELLSLMSTWHTKNKEYHQNYALLSANNILQSHNIIKEFVEIADVNSKTSVVQELWCPVKNVRFLTGLNGYPLLKKVNSRTLQSTRKTVKKRMHCHIQAISCNNLTVSFRNLLISHIILYK